MGTADVKELSRDDVTRERSEILASVRLTEEELRDQARLYLLSDAEAAAWRRYSLLTWLAGE